jgi:hypothetical protein
MTLLLLASCSSDNIPFSSGMLDGELAAPPANWSGVGELKVIQLETRPAEPYSVKLWVVEMGGALYVHAGDNRAQWVEHIEADGRVRLEAQGKLYELSAFRVYDQEEFDAFIEPYEAKYGRRPGNEDINEVYLFRLQAR